MLCALAGHSAAITDLAALSLHAGQRAPRAAVAPAAAVASLRGGGASAAAAAGGEAEWSWVTEEVLRSTESRAGPPISSASASSSLVLAADSSLPPPIIWDGGGGRMGDGQDGAQSFNGLPHPSPAAPPGVNSAAAPAAGSAGEARASQPRPYAPLGPLLVSGSYDASLRVWDLAADGGRGACEAVLTGHRSPVWSVAAVDALIFSAAACGSVHVWRIEEAAPPHAEPHAPAAPGRRLRWSVLGTWGLPRPLPIVRQIMCLRVVGDAVITGGGDGCVRAWDALTGRHLWQRSAAAALSDAAAANAADASSSNALSIRGGGGSPVGSKGALGAIRRLTVVGNLVYTLSQSGALTCFSVGRGAGHDVVATLRPAASAALIAAAAPTTVCPCSGGACRCDRSCHCKRANMASPRP